MLCTKKYTANSPTSSTRDLGTRSLVRIQQITCVRDRQVWRLLVNCDDGNVTDMLACGLDS